MAISNSLHDIRYLSLVLALSVTLLGGANVARAAGGEGGDDKPASEYSLAKQALDDGDYDIAINKLARLHEENPNDADVLNLLGYGYRKIGNFDQARGYYLQALAVDPEHRGANEYLGELYLETDKLGKAEERLAVLDAACWLGCEEYTELKESIAKFKADKGIQ